MYVGNSIRSSLSININQSVCRKTLQLDVPSLQKQKIPGIRSKSTAIERPLYIYRQTISLFPPSRSRDEKKSASKTERTKSEIDSAKSNWNLWRSNKCLTLRNCFLRRYSRVCVYAQSGARLFGKKRRKKINSRARASEKSFDTRENRDEAREREREIKVERARARGDNPLKEITDMCIINANEITSCHAAYTFFFTLISSLSYFCPVPPLSRFRACAKIYTKARHKARLTGQTERRVRE